MFILYILILLGLLSIVMFPYERVAVCRIRAVRKIAVLCRERDINFKVINHLYPFSRNKNSTFDFIIRIDNTVIPVKFFSATERKTTMILDNSGKICIAGKYRDPLSRSMEKQFKTVKRYDSLPVMKISKKIILIGDGKKKKHYLCYLILKKKNI